ncbi:hypothetical protein [Legionella shakespearei]|uniref:Uncharacterized protein n=1 Tax=Legionella shakespearei DSM 23087 TaxID=1122169 RepID=A0A0W0Z4W8_9GAMM|nr:hypothetical protein [Legionella shakespearei]KTD64165.1 hypothetical protein Lsha_0596 [Legionella shakespearei DSM 23087]
MTDFDNEQDVSDMFKKATEMAKAKKEAEQQATTKVGAVPNSGQNGENYDPLAGNTFDHFNPDEDK